MRSQRLSIRPDYLPCRQPAHVRADALAVLQEHALPRLVQVNPLRRLAALTAKLQVTADDGAVGEAQRRRPVRAEGPNGDCGGHRQQLASDSGLFQELTSCSTPWRLASLDRATWRYPPSYAMPNEQDMAVGRVGDPDLGRQRRRQRRAGAEPRLSVIELHGGETSIGDRRVHGHLVNHLAQPMPTPLATWCSPRRTARFVSRPAATAVAATAVGVERVSSQPRHPAPDTTRAGRSFARPASGDMPTQYLPKQGYLPNRGELRVPSRPRPLVDVDDLQIEKRAAAVAAQPQGQPYRSRPARTATTGLGRVSQMSVS